MTRNPTTLLKGGTFFECPRWRDGRWYVTDIYRHAIVSLSESGTDAVDVVKLPQELSGTGWLPDGSLVFVAAHDHRLLRLSDDRVSVLASFGEYCTGAANELVVDARGRAYVANIGFSPKDSEVTSGKRPPTGRLIRVDCDGSVHTAADELLFPNGMVITPDGATLVVGESLGARYTAFSIAPDGSLGNRRLWAALGSNTGRSPTPDGCTLDAQGRIWFADAFGSRCALVEQGGRTVEEIRMPDGLNVYACMLGGFDGRTLLLCCAPDYLPATRAAADDAVLLSVRVEVPHAGSP